MGRTLLLFLRCVCKNRVTREMGDAERVFAHNRSVIFVVEMDVRKARRSWGDGGCILMRVPKKDVYTLSYPALDKESLLGDLRVKICGEGM